MRSLQLGHVHKVRHHLGGFGTFVVVESLGTRFLYAHLNKVTVSQGDTVYPGKQIGTVGSTGSSTGPHLHYARYLNGQPDNPGPICLLHWAP